MRVYMNTYLFDSLPLGNLVVCYVILERLLGKDRRRQRLGVNKGLDGMVSTEAVHDKINVHGGSVEFEICNGDQIDKPAVERPRTWGN